MPHHRQADNWENSNNELEQSIQGTRLTQNTHLFQAWTNYKFSSKQTLSMVANLAWAQNMDSNIAVTCFDHSWGCRHPTKVTLDFLESLGRWLHFSYSYQKQIHRWTWQKMLIFQICTNIDRKLTRTSKMQNWSSRDTTRLSLNFM
jgi:hypothetical protein